MASDSYAFRSALTRSGCVFSVLICCGWTQEIGAAGFTYNIGYRAEHSDNIFRIPDERAGQSEVINSINAGFTFLEDSSTFIARVVGSAVYQDYYRETFDNQKNLTLDARGEYFFVPRVLSWVAVDGFRKVQIDPLQPDTPVNRQNSNVFATGPNVYLRLGTLDTLTFEGRYGRAWVENVEIDNDRDSFATRWAHRVSARSTLSLNYEYLDVDYENSILNTDFRRHNLFVRADVRSARNQYTFDLGRTKVDLESGEPSSNWLVRLASAWQASSISSVGLLYGREYSDTMTELLPTGVASQATSGGVAAPSLGTDIVTGELLYTERTEFFYARRGNTFPWVARLFSRNIDYELSPNDREEKGTLVDIRYLYSNALSFQAFSSYTILTYDQLAREDRDAVTGVVLLYRAGPSLTAGLDLRRFGRNSTDSTQEYTDDRISITITYATRPVTH